MRFAAKEVPVVELNNSVIELSDTEDVEVNNKRQRAKVDYIYIVILFINCAVTTTHICRFNIDIRGNRYTTKIINTWA